MKDFAAQLDLDTEQFNQCLDSGKYTDYVQEQVNQGRSFGVQSTPAFIINGRALVGAQPFDVFQQVIDLQLEDSGS